MRRILAVSAMVLAMALVVTPGTSNGEPRTRQGCQTKECFHRVAKKRKIHRLGFWNCNTWKCVARVKKLRVKRQRTRMLKEIAPYRAWLGRVGACESGTGSHNLKVGVRAYSSAGPFIGRYQFMWSTWSKVKSSNLWRADWLEQAHGAVRWVKVIGWNNRKTSMGWPVCGY